MTVETTFPKKIVSGENSLTYLKNLKGKRASLVISGTFARTNPAAVDLVEKILKEIGIAWHIIYSQGQEPTLEYVKESAQKVQEFLPDTIVTIGGGSTIDAAKIMEVLYEYPDISDEDLFKRFNLPSIRNKIKTFIAIQTTSGTGAEVTPFNIVSVKTDNPDIPLIKTAVADYQTIPDVIILDPIFTISMPPAITAATGMDALVHAIEAYISNKPKNVFSDLYALEAIKIVFEYLPKAYKDGKNLIARAKMQYAATMAGIAIANRGTGLAHGIGQQLGPVLGIRHGISVSIVLQAVLEYNEPLRKKEYLKIANHIGITKKNEEETIKIFLEKLKELMESINFPSTIQDIGIEKVAYLKNLDQMAKNAKVNGPTLTNPRVPTIEEIKKIFLTLC